MERREYLLLRGWISGDEGWRNRRTHSAPCTEETAFWEQRKTDEHHLEAFGSLLYWPTAAQAQSSPLCAALAASHRTEASVIEHLFRENQRLETRLREEVERGYHLQVKRDEWRSKAEGAQAIGDASEEVQPAAQVVSNG